MAGEVFHGPGEPPVRGTGVSTKPKSKWSYGHSPWAILQGAADDPSKAPSDGNIFGQLKLGADRTGAAIHQAGYNLLQPFSTEGQIQTAIWGPTDEPNSLIDTTKAFVGTAAKSFGMDLFKDNPGVQEIMRGEVVADTAAATEAMDAPSVEEIAAEAEDIVIKLDQLNEYAQHDLDDTSQWQVNQMRLMLEDQLDELELQLEQAEYKLGFQDKVFELDADALGLDIDFNSLSEAIEMEGGVGKQTLEAIHAIANDAALSAEEKSDQIDLVTARFNFSEAMKEGIDEMVQNRDDLQRLQELTDVEFAHEMGVAQFFQPAFVEVVEADEGARHLGIVEQTVFESELGELISTFSEIEFDVLDGALAGAIQFGLEDPQVRQAILNLSQLTDTEFSSWRNVLQQAIKQVEVDRQAFERSIDATSLTPGTKSMVYAIMNAGRNLNIGLDDEILTLLANAGELHAIIKVKSEGKAGEIGAGTIRGIGGLTEDMYVQLMDEEWTPDRGMEWELQALLLYLLRGFGGDPMQAMEFFQQTGEWGGVSSLKGSPDE